MNKQKRYPNTIIASVVIPWTEDYKMDEKMFRDEIKGLLERGLKHIYLFGTGGEGYAVTDEQFEEIVRIFAEEMKETESYPMVGALSLSYTTIIKRLKIAYNYGIRDFLIAMPCWGALTDEEMHRFFVDVCGSFPDCRFLNYNLPRAKRLISVKEFEDLGREIPNFAGAKFCSKDLFVVRDIATSQSDLQFFVNEIALIHGNWLGQCGLLSAVGNCNIKRTLEFFNATINGDIETSLKLGKELAGVHKGLSICCSKGKMDGAYDKLYAKLINPEFPLRLLPPYSTFSEEEFENFRLYIKNNYPQWLEPQSMY